LSEEGLEGGASQVGEAARVSISPYALIIIIHVSAAALAALATVLIGVDKTGGRIALGVTTAVTASGAIQLVWRLMGGAPLDLEVKNLRAAVHDLRAANATMADLSATGIEHLYPERSTRWVEIRRKWRDHVSNAKEIDLMGLSLYGLWFKHEDLAAALENAAAREGTTVRVLTLPLPDRYSRSLEQRMQQLGEEQMYARLPALLSSTYNVLRRLPSVMSSHRPVTKSTLYSSIVRIGDYVYVAPYMASVEGDDSLAFEAHGPGGKAFELYTQEFEKIWTDEEAPSEDEQPPAEEATSPHDRPAE
jgi:hypothetical protein